MKRMSKIRSSKILRRVTSKTAQRLSKLEGKTKMGPENKLQEVVDKLTFHRFALAPH